MSPSTHARAAALVFAAQAVFPIAHLATASRYPGCTLALSVVTDLGLWMVWGAAACAGFVQHPLSAYFAMLCGIATSATHGVLFSVLLSSHGPYGVGIPFLVAAGLAGYFVAHALPAFEARAGKREREQVIPSVGWRLAHGRRRTGLPAS